MTRRFVGLTVAVVLVLAACSGPAMTTTTTTTLAGQPLPGDGTLELGITYRMTLFIHCGMEALYPQFNGAYWSTTEAPYRGSGAYPDGFREAFVDPDEAISPNLMVRATLVADDELLLTLPDGSYPTTYRPTEDEPIACT